jgi:hypothetical protein
MKSVLNWIFYLVARIFSNFLSILHGRNTEFEFIFELENAVQWARPPGFVSHLAIAELTCRGAARRVAHARRALSPVGALLSERKPHQTLCNGARPLGFVSHLAIAELTCKGAARRAAMYLTGAELPVMPLAAASGCLAAGAAPARSGRAARR